MSEHPGPGPGVFVLFSAILCKLSPGYVYTVEPGELGQSA